MLVGQEDRRGVTPGLLEPLVAEPDALAPSEPMPGLAGTRARDLHARLPAKRAEHDRDPAAHLRERRPRASA